MKLEHIPITEIHPYGNNPRKNTEAVRAVANSIKEFGFRVPLVIDRENVIVCGHTRYLACQKLGMKTVPCVRADDLTEAQIRAYRLADNKTGEIAGWDFEKLGFEMQALESFDMGGFGFMGGFQARESYERPSQTVTISDAGNSYSNTAESYSDMGTDDEDEDEEEIVFDDFDGKGDGGGSYISNGTKCRIVIGTLMFDLSGDLADELYKASKTFDREKVAQFILESYQAGKL